MKIKGLISIFLFFIISTFCWRCKIPYYPPETPKQTNYLVVEGYISSNIPTVIKLSRTRVVSQFDTARVVAETNAKVIVQDDHGDRYSLEETAPGTYTMGSVSLDSSYKYSLYISTSSGREYQSDFVPFRSSPPITGIDWNLLQNDLQVYVKTQTLPNKTPYYHWSYTETWEYHTPYTSYYEYFPAAMAVGIRVHPVHICWVTNNSTDVVIGSSVGLSGNRIHSPLVFFPQHDERLSVLYSVLITQYAVDTAAYNFWKEMKTNSEDLGSIFSPLPNQVRGNIHCVSDSTEEVIGYVGAGSTSQYRAFIENSSLPATWNPPTQCSSVFVPESKIVDYFSSGFIPLYTDFVDNQKGYDAAYESCADCTYKGSPVKPSFWP